MGVPARLIDFLNQSKVRYEVLHHPEAFTAQELAAIEHVKGRSHAKVVMVKAGGEFNVVIDMEISQQALPRKGVVPKDRRVGKCEATFHVTPKVHHKAKALRKAK